VLSETAARWGLVLHAVLGAAAVGAATHLVLWMRKYIRGEHDRRRAVRRFAWYAVILHALAFTAGNIVYPTYRVEIRAAYLEHPARMADDREARDEALAKLAARENTQPYAQQPMEQVTRRASTAVKAFDIKEHWTALGLFASLALALTLAFWDPKTDGPALKPVVMGLSLLVAGTVWLGAIIGVLTSAWRGV
jgi:DMSO reductase anchor subunit